MADLTSMVVERRAAGLTKEADVLLVPDLVGADFNLFPGAMNVAGTQYVFISQNVDPNEAGSFGSMAFIDVSTPTAPSFLGVSVTSDGVSEQTVSWGAIVWSDDDSTMYSFRDSGGNIVLSVWDASGGASAIPTLSSSPIIRSTASIDPTKDKLVKAGSWLFFYDSGDGKIVPIDISTPGTPSVGTGVAYTIDFERGVASSDGDYLFLTGVGTAGSEAIQLIDITTPAVPVVVAAQITITLNGTLAGISDHIVEISGTPDRIYCTANESDVDYWVIFEKGTDWEDTSTATSILAPERALPEEAIADTTTFGGTTIGIFRAATDGTFYVLYRKNTSDSARPITKVATWSTTVADDTKFLLRYLGSMGLMIYDNPDTWYDAMSSPLFGVEYNSTSGLLVGIDLISLSVVVFQDRDQAWQDLTPFVLNSPGVSLSYGIKGTESTERVGQTGTMSFSLDNSQFNNTATIGLFSPDHASLQTGFAVGNEIRVALTYGGTTYYKWRGVIDTIVPVAGLKRTRNVAVTCVDWFDQIARIAVEGLTLETDVLADAMLTTLIKGVPAKPISTSFDIGGFTYAYAWDQSQSTQISPMMEFARIANSDLGYIYLKGDTVEGGKLVFQNRDARSALVSKVTLTDVEPSAVVVQHGRAQVQNSVEVEVFPRTVDAAATTVLYSLNEATEIAANATFEFKATYRDPNEQASKVGGLEMVTPVATTDYTMNRKSDGSGKDKTSEASVTVKFESSQAIVQVTNTGPDRVFLTKFQLRGKGVYTYSPFSSIVEDAASQQRYGKSKLSFSLTYQNDPEVAEETASVLLFQNKDPNTKVTSLTLVGNTNDTNMTQVLAREVGDKITLSETVTGLATKSYFINSIDINISGPQFVRCSWLLAPDVETFWRLELPTYEFDGSSRLERDADLTGAADSKSGTVSLWFKCSPSASQMIILSADNNNNIQIKEPNGEIRLVLRNTANTIILDMTSNTVWADGTWHHLVASWDLANTTGQLYVDGVDDLAAGSTLTDDTVDWTRGDVGIGATSGGSPGVNPYTGKLGQFWFDLNYIDLTDADNLAKFYDSGPVAMGEHGDTPTGVPPIIFWNSTLANILRNSGTGGDWGSETGDVTKAATAPVGRSLLGTNTTVGA